MRIHRNNRDSRDVRGPGPSALAQGDLSFVQGLFPEEQAFLDDQTHVTSTTGTVVPNGSTLVFSPSSRATISGLSPLAGRYWGATIFDQTSVAGTHRLRFLSPTYQPESGRTLDGFQTWEFPALAGSVSVDFLTGGGTEGALQYLQVVDMDATLGNPCDIYIAMGQSNMAASTKSLGVDPYKDHWVDKRALYVPGKSYIGYGTTRGDVHPLHAPLQHGGESSANGLGVSPAVAFGQYMVGKTPQNRNMLIVAAAISGTSLVASDAAWNSRGTDPVAYDNAVDLCTTLFPTLPSGSTYKGVIWAQGEGDISADMSAYPPAFAAMRSDFEAAIGSGALPWVILTGAPDAVNPNQAHFIETQTNMDQDSGHPTAQTGVYAVNRLAAGTDDGTHVVAQGQRIAGKLAAKRMAEVLGV